MKPKIDEVTKIFIFAGWQEIALSNDMQKAGLNAIYTNNYATVGVVISSTISDVKAMWNQCQGEMANLRNSKDVGTEKDLYLIFLIRKFDVKEIQNLRDMINDTYVCRKICLELNDRPLEETLNDIPFLRLISQTESKLPEVVVKKVPEQELPPMVEDDLSQNAAETILDNLLAGKYKGGHE